LSGEVELHYFVGSNTRGRTYLFERDGLWFEAPVNWYAKKRLWDMAPNFQNAHDMPLTLPVDANCLHCHATGVAVALPGARNHFAAAPFAQGGIGCSACHGDASEHLRTRGRVPMLNPARLDPVRRDSVCLQCHLEGETAVYRPGRSLAAFGPGQNLFDSVSYFVYQGEIGASGRASSQYEALLESACKRASGDRLTCTTCHDPHGTETTMSPAERSAYYRAKCLGCHTGAAFARDHHPEQPDCASCHMPRSPSEDIAHEQVTDHRIHLPADRNRAHAAGAELEPIGGQHVSDRERGLAYAQMAQRGDRTSREKALQLLRESEAMQSPAVIDPELHTELGFLEEQSGNIAAADREFRAALAADPDAGAARGDLAVLFARTGDYTTAVRLWQRVFEKDPSQDTAGYDLAVGECRLGQKEDAETTLKILLRFSPDDQRARALAAAIAGGAEHCGK
jgi:thioredoxin-like negative regulator of GroEL